MEAAPVTTGTWETFKPGFGSSTCNYWLGNDWLHQVTKDGLYKARFEVQQKSTETWFWAEYTTFIVDSEATKLSLIHI